MRYALIGDSQGQGLFGALSAHLASRGHAVVYSRAVAGRDPGGWTRDADLRTQLAAAAPDVVVYLVAGNNGDMNATSYSGKVGTLIGWARSAGARTVYWLSPATATEPSTSARHEGTANMEARIVPGLGATWIDMRPYTRTGHRDGVHFTSTAYAAWAAALAPALLPSASGAVVGTGTGTGAASWAWWAVGGVLALGLVFALRLRATDE